MRQFAAPLKVSASSKSDAANPALSPGLSPGFPGNRSVKNMVAGFNKTTPATSSLSSSKIEDITSPHELTAYVEQLITQIEGKFDEMSTQILERMNQMSSRVDTLEASIQDLINSDGQPATPGTPSTSTR